MMKETGSAHLSQIVEEKLSTEQNSETNTPSASHDANAKRLQPNLPRRYLFSGLRENYLKTGVPLYEASIKCDWKAAKEILDKTPKLVKCSITENGETALHVAASAKIPKLVDEFVQNLVDLMDADDLALENENFNTAFYLAAAAGNIEPIKIMLKKNRALLKIPGAKGMMPLYAAALFGNHDVVKYLYEYSSDLSDDAGWSRQKRGWLLEKCVENNMFDVSIKIMKKYPELGSGNVLLQLARKREAFREMKSNIIGKPIKLVKNLYLWMFITKQPSENKHQEEPGSGRVPEDLDQKPEAPSEIKSTILRRAIMKGKNLYALMFIKHQPFEYKNSGPGNGRVPGDMDGKLEVSPETKSNIIGRIIQPVFAFFGSKVGSLEKESEALQLLRIIWGDIAKKPKNEIDRILRGPADLNNQDKSASGRVVQVMQLQKLISKHLQQMKTETDNIMSEQPDSTKQDTSPATIKAIQVQKLRNLLSDRLVNMHVETQNIIKGAPEIKQDNKPISGKADLALQLQKLVSEYIVNMHDETQKIIEIPGKEDLAPKLQNVIYVEIDKMNKELQKIIRRPAKLTYSSRILFIAAEMGNTEFLVELIRQYPDLIWKVNDNNQSIFHIAVKHRHRGIYNLLHEIGAMKDLITPLRDSKDNNMLHLVGTCAKQKRLECVSGVALQMQRELLWFHEVRNMIPPSYRERKNEDDLTPHELFTMEHKDLVTQGEKWMKDTASQCMVVAALIATIVFAAAFTVPGGYDQNNGIPVFKSKATFIVFVVADAISLFSSSASILMFLSILTSRYAERDFLESLPRKLMFGLATLFLSITTMTVAFGVSFFVLYYRGLLWIPILIGVFAVLPVLLYIRLQYSLFVDVIRSTYGSRYLFKPQKHVLYYKTPTV